MRTHALFGNGMALLHVYPRKVRLHYYAYDDYTVLSLERKKYLVVGGNVLNPIDGGTVGIAEAGVVIIFHRPTVGIIDLKTGLALTANMLIGELCRTCPTLALLLDVWHISELLELALLGMIADRTSRLEYVQPIYLHNLLSYPNFVVGYGIDGSSKIDLYYREKNSGRTLEGCFRNNLLFIMSDLESYGLRFDVHFDSHGRTSIVVSHRYRVLAVGHYNHETCTVQYEPTALLQALSEQ